MITCKCQKKSIISLILKEFKRLLYYYRWSQLSLFLYLSYLQVFHNARPMFTVNRPIVNNPDTFTGCNNAENTDEKA